MNKIEDRDNAILEARRIVSGRYVVLDTETTGMNMPEAVQIGCVNQDGEILDLLVKPSKSIEQGAILVTGITDDMVSHQPMFDYYLDKLADFVGDGLFVAYNAPYDLGVLKNSANACHVSIEFNNVVDAMQVYAQFYGEINWKFGSYKWHKLTLACSQCGLVFKGKAHGALADAMMTKELMLYVASQKTSQEGAQ